MNQISKLVSAVKKMSSNELEFAENLKYYLDLQLKLHNLSQKELTNLSLEEYKDHLLEKNLVTSDMRFHKIPFSMSLKAT